MDKTKELIETWKKIFKILHENEDAFYYGICQYADTASADKECLMIEDYENHLEKMNEIIKSLEAKNGHTN